MVMPGKYVWNPGARIAFPRTVVHDAIGPLAWTDLDVSAVTGARHALVTLSFENGSGGNCEFFSRRNGEAVVGAYRGSAGSAVIGNGLMIYHVLPTDGAGIIEWHITNAAGTITIIVEAYVIE